MHVWFPLIIDIIIWGVLPFVTMFNSNEIKYMWRTALSIDKPHRNKMDIVGAGQFNYFPFGGKVEMVGGQCLEGNMLIQRGCMLAMKDHGANFNVYTL